MHRFSVKSKILSLFYPSVRLSSNKTHKLDTPIQYVRPVRSQVRNSKPLKSYRTYDNELMINKTLLKKFDSSKIEQEFDEDDEELYQQLVHQPDGFYDEYKRDEKAHRELVKRKTIERKYFKKEKEPCLITWAAREQICYLNSLDPSEWTPKRLSQSFPISEETVKKILKSPSKWGRNISDERKQRHDKVVANNWKLLKEGKLENVKTELLQLHLEGKLSSNLAMPNLNLPQSKPKQMLEAEVPKPKGEFLSLIAPYLNSNADKPTNLDVNIPSLVIGGKFLKTEDDFPKKSKHKYSRSQDLTSEQFRKTLDNKVKFIKAEKKESIPKVLNKPQIEDYFVEKYKRPIELTIDSKNAYLYSPRTSYQHPIGETEPDPDKIEIPKSKFREGALYKVNNSFYSDDGEFLFKVPNNN